MSLVRNVVALTLLSATLENIEKLSAQCVGHWTGNSPNWSTGWTPCTPNNVGDTGIFDAVNPTFTMVNVDNPYTITTITFPKTDNYTIINSNTLTFQSNTLFGMVNVIAGSQTIDTDLNLENAINVTVNSNLTFGPDCAVTGRGLFFYGTNGVFTNNSPNINNAGGFTFSDITINNNGSINCEFIMNSGIFNQSSSGQVNNSGLFQIDSGLANISGSIFTQSFNLSDANIFLNNATFNGINGGLATANLFLENGTVFNSNIFSIDSGFMNIDSSSSLSINNFTIQNGQLDNFGTINIINPANAILSGGILVNDGIINDTSITEEILKLTGTEVFGTGTFNTAVSNVSSIVSPGDIGNTGQLTFTSYEQLVGGTLNINILNDSNFGSINYLDNVSLNGTLQATFLPGSQLDNPATLLPIISTTNNLGFVTGNFSSVTSNNPNLFPIVTQTNDEVFLSFAPVLNSVFNFKEVVFSNLNQIHFLLLKEMEELRDCRNFGLFVIPFGSVGVVHSRKGTTGFDFNTHGVLVGADKNYGSLGIGASVDYSRFWGHGFNNFGRFDIDQLHGNIYATYELCSCVYLDGIVGGGYDWVRINRNTGFLADANVKSKPDSKLFDAFLGLEYYMTYENFCSIPKNVNIIPLAAIQYSFYDLNHYREVGASFINFNHHRQQYESYRTTLGLTVNADYALDCWKITPQLNINWQKQFNDDDRVVIVDNLNAPSSFIPISGSARDTILGGVDILTQYERYFADVGYEVEVNQRYSNHFFYLKLGAAF